MEASVLHVWRPAISEIVIKAVRMVPSSAGVHSGKVLVRPQLAAATKNIEHGLIYGRTGGRPAMPGVRSSIYAQEVVVLLTCILLVYYSL